MTGMSRSHHDPRARPPASRVLVVFATMLALCLQALVVQTHVHAFASVTGAIHATAGNEDPRDDHAHASTAQDRVACAVCLAFASAGQMTLPTVAAVPAEVVTSNEAATISIRLAPRAITHSWQGRAPPIPL